MKPPIHQALAALPARQLNLVAIGLVLIALALAWSVGLRGPLAAYRQQSAALAALEASLAGAPAPAPGTAAPSNPAPAATPTPAPAPAPAPLALIAAVSASAARAGVTVSSAAQGAQYPLADLQVHLLEITASGDYTAIVGWLADIEASQPTVGVVQLGLQPGPAGAADTRTIKLQLAIYDKGVAP